MRAIVQRSDLIFTAVAKRLFRKKCGALPRPTGPIGKLTRREFSHGTVLFQTKFNDALESNKFKPSFTFAVKVLLDLAGH